jgi:L-lactate dehydrogenase complex protein LldF
MNTNNDETKPKVQHTKVLNHADAASVFIKDGERTDWHDETLWFVRSKRDVAVQQVPEWEQLRSLASQIKDHTLSNLDNYLIQFEEKGHANGIKVHWAADAAAHNEIILD